MNKKDKRAYDKIYYQKHKEKRKLSQKKHYNKKRKECLEYSKKYNKEYNKLKDVKEKNRIRKRTIRKYGKAPKGYQYHHQPPYNEDNFKILKEKEHRELVRKSYKKRGIKIE